MNMKDHIFRIPAAYLKVMIQLAAAEGIAPDALIGGTMLSPENLRHSDRPIPLSDARRVLAVLPKRFGKAG